MSISNLCHKALVVLISDTSSQHLRSCSPNVCNLINDGMKHMGFSAAKPHLWLNSLANNFSLWNLDRQVRRKIAARHSCSAARSRPSPPACARGWAAPSGLARRRVQRTGLDREALRPPSRVATPSSCTGFADKGEPDPGGDAAAFCTTPPVGVQRRGFGSPCAPASSARP